jgi:hypothetical protein
VSQKVPAKIIAKVIGHAKVDTTLNVYTQVLDESVRTAVERRDGIAQNCSVVEGDERANSWCEKVGSDLPSLIRLAFELRRAFPGSEIRG